MGDAKLKAVLVGCGGMSRAWLGPATKMTGLSIVGLVDINLLAAQKRAAEYQLPESVVYPTLKDALAKARPDVVFDVTIPAAHRVVTLEALAAGCHVLGEKPMAENLADAQAMLSAAKKANRLYAVIQNRRYEPHIRQVKQLIADGGIGTLNEMHADFYLGPHFGGFRDEMAHPLLVDMAIHTFDQARYISQADPAAVYCHTFNPAHSWYKGDASAVCIFEMTGGLVYTYRGSWAAQGVPTSWEGQWRFVGSHGSMTWDGAAGIVAQRSLPRVPDQFDTPFTSVDVPQVALEHTGHTGLIHEFIDCIQHAGTPLTICDDNIKSLAMVLAAMKSAASGQREPVTW